MTPLVEALVATMKSMAKESSDDVLVDSFVALTHVAPDGSGFTSPDPAAGIPGDVKLAMAVLLDELQSRPSLAAVFAQFELDPH